VKVRRREGGVLREGRKTTQNDGRICEEESEEHEAR
jgi:hypothetical protein